MLNGFPCPGLDNRVRSAERRFRIRKPAGALFPAPTFAGNGCLMFELAVVIALVLAVVALIRIQDATAELRGLRSQLEELEKRRGEFTDPRQSVTKRAPRPAGSRTAPAGGSASPPAPAAPPRPGEPPSATGEEEAAEEEILEEAKTAGLHPETPRKAETETAAGDAPSVRPLAPLPASLRREAPSRLPRWDDDELLPVVGRRRSPEHEGSWLRGGDDKGADPSGGPSAFEARFGSTWLLRIGLVFLVLAAALFALVVTPRVGPAGKVSLAYAFAALLFGAGLLSRRLRNFAQPVMAGGLSIAFFVSYAAYFIEPMRCVPVPVSLSLMGVFVAAILFFSDRWRSEFTGGLAIFLGHAATFVAARSLESPAPSSLVAVIFLSAAAVVLLLRHSWVMLSLFAVVAAYGSHALWITLAEDVATPRQALYVNLAFLSSYYLIFASSDLIWWRRRDSAKDGTPNGEPQEATSAPAATPTLGLTLAPLNLVLYTGLVSLIYLETEVFLGSIHLFYFALAGVQGVLAVVHRKGGHQRFLLYPAASTVLLTLGFFSAFERLALNLVLAGEAMVLLMVAHQTRLRLFHLLSQAALAANFIHYWIYAATIDPSRARFMGGMLTAAVYLVKSSLEEIWYGRGSTFRWIESRPVSKFLRELSDAFDRTYGLLTPVLPHLHAAGGALILIHQSGQFLSPADAGLVLTVGVIGFAAVGAWRASVPMLIVSTTLYAGVLALQGFEPGEFRFPASPDFPAAWRAGINGAGAWAALLGYGLMAGRRNLLPLRYGLLLWPGVTLALFLVAYGRTPLGEVGEGMPFILGLLALFAATGAVERLTTSMQLRRPASPAASAAVRVFEVLAGVTLAWHFNTHFEWRFGDAPIRFILLSGLASALPLIGLVRRSAGVYSAGALLMILVFITILSSASTRDALFASLPATVAVALPLVAAAWTQDLIARLFEELLSAAQKRLALAAVGLPYFLGVVLLMHLAEYRVEAPWHFPVQAGLAAALMFATQPLRLVRGAVLSIFFYFTIGLFFVLGNEAELRNNGPYLAAAGLLVVGGWVMERGWSLGEKAMRPRKAMDISLISAGRVVLLLTATVVALTSAWASTLIGVRWTTAAWAVYAAIVMIMGFAYRLASFRRTALGVLALGIARVLLVDIRKLETLYQAIALLVLGLCLVAIAWLYSRFSAQLRRWL